MTISTSTKTKTTKRWALYKTGHGLMAKRFTTREDARTFKDARSNYKIYDLATSSFVR